MMSPGSSSTERQEECKADLFIYIHVSIKGYYRHFNNIQMREREREMEKIWRGKKETMNRFFCMVAVSRLHVCQIVYLYRYLQRFEITVCPTAQEDLIFSWAGTKLHIIKKIKLKISEEKLTRKFS